MSLYTPTTWVNGGAPAIDQGNLNNIETGIVEAHKFYGGRWYRSTTQSIPSATNTNITWTDESFDVGGYFAPSGTQITVPANHGGKFSVTAQVSCVSTMTGPREIAILKNGSTLTDGNAIVTMDSTPTSIGSRLQVTSVLQLNAAEYFTVMIWHNTGTSQNVRAGAYETWVSVTRLGD